jgi:hypothetical protein
MAELSGGRQRECDGQGVASRSGDAVTNESGQGAHDFRVVAGPSREAEVGGQSGERDSVTVAHHFEQRDDPPVGAHRRRAQTVEPPGLGGGGAGIVTEGLEDGVAVGDEDQGVVLGEPPLEAGRRVIG